MGLAGPKKRTKISNDPNNTSWTRSTSGYGHKIMTSQGWAPGDYLGVANSNRTDTYTAASFGHIRVSLKDDTLGLGAKPRRPLIDDEPTGLDAFQGLLGRLNGRSEVEIEKEMKVKRDIKAMTYIERRWGCMNFIGGGLLVPDKVNKIPNGGVNKDSEDSEGVRPVEESASEDTNKKESRKREKREKKERKEKKEKSKEKKKEQRKEAEESRDIADSGFATELSAPGSRAGSPGDADSKSEKQRSKDKKKSKKRKRKEEALASKSQSPAPSDDEDAKSAKADDTSSRVAAPIAVKERVIPISRQLLRGRYIQQKRRAVMDSKSLNEVCLPGTTPNIKL
ncbi:telomerase inhibitor [Microsporum canis]|uniref:G-patch domain-containing protein n=1 Tax=Arthroderma otae (strain ATCC MYA-4605 / CBS 113480) TaxID=554155 RepID=C5FY85_ARTOC|nr:G-patch domain-containing protein [Microsporum canis CBS 113480]EEQ34483.1 G-patch domain-containing protein [Microsporum canis CBS 113480]